MSKCISTVFISPVNSRNHFSLSQIQFVWHFCGKTSPDPETSVSDFFSICQPFGRLRNVFSRNVNLRHTSVVFVFCEVTFLLFESSIINTLSALKKASFWSLHTAVWRPARQKASCWKVFETVPQHETQLLLNFYFGLSARSSSNMIFWTWRDQHDLLVINVVMRSKQVSMLNMSFFWDRVHHNCSEQNASLAWKSCRKFKFVEFSFETTDFPFSSTFNDRTENHCDSCMGHSWEETRLVFGFSIWGEFLKISRTGLQTQTHRWRASLKKNQIGKQTSKKLML